MSHFDRIRSELGFKRDHQSNLSLHESSSGLDDVKLDNVDDALDDIARGNPCLSQCLLVTCTSR